MITIDFTSRGTMGLCDYLIHSIKKQITEGVLPPETRLPSKRSLAEHLGISVITVQNAYGRLIDEGYIYSIEKKGFFVTDIKALKGEHASKLYGLKQSAVENSREEVSKDFLYDFTSNAVSKELFPFSQWAHLMRQVLNSTNSELLKRQDVWGALELREAIRDFLSGFRNMKVKAGQIVIGAGTESLYTMIVQLFGQDKNYAVENPGYKKVYSVIKLNGATCTPIDIDSSGMNPSLLSKMKADIVHVSPSHHFPTGTVMPIKRRNELLSWAYEAKDRYIIEDDYDSEFRFTGKPLLPLQALDTEGRVIYMNTFSKTLSPSFRISYMILPESLIPQFRKRLGFTSCPVSAFEQYTLSAFIRQGFYEKHIIRMKNHYRNLRNQFILAIQSSPLKNITEIMEEEAGLHFILKVNTQKKEEEIESSLKDKKINLPLLMDYYYDEAEDSAHREKRCCFLINYSAIQKSQIHRIVELMTEAMIN